MTVGVPEINLDTWGLKYVKKKGATNQGGADRLGLGGNTGSNRTADEQGAESKISGSKTPSTKPTESTTVGNRASDADLDTPDAFSIFSVTAVILSTGT